MKSPLSLRVFSDIHLGHRKTPSSEIIERLYQQINNQPDFTDLDLLLIPGDMFDRHLSLPNEEVFEIHSFLSWLLHWCKRWSVALRVLEGTPSHDWKQSRLLSAINESDVGADARHISDLYIEHIEHLDCHILYIPDEHRTDPEDTYNEVCERMRSLGLKQVDFAVMHGQFDFQLPAHVKAPKHDSERYQALVRHYIFIGHVHTPTHRDKIIAPGSFDRLAHNETEAKGHWELTVRENGDDEITFVENTQAKPYVTIDLRESGLDNAIATVSQEIATLPIGAHVRIHAQKQEGAMDVIGDIKKHFPQFHWAHKLDQDTDTTQMVVEDLRARAKLEPITADSIHRLTEERLKRLTDDPQQQQAALNKLCEVTDVSV